MLVLLNKNIEEYHSNHKYSYKNVFMYNLPESIIKKEILKGNVYSALYTKDFINAVAFDSVKLQCIAGALHKTENTFKGECEKLIEPYLMSGYTNQLLIEYIETIIGDDIPDVLELLKHDMHSSLRFGICIDKQVPHAEEYFKNTTWANYQTTLLLKQYEEKFNMLFT